MFLQPGKHKQQEWCQHAVSISITHYLCLFLNISSLMVNFGWHRLTRIRLIKFTLKYQLQKACVSNISSTGQSGRGLPRNLFHFSRSLSGWDLLNDALKGMSLFTTFYYWWEPIWSLLCCARGAASPGDWWTELEGIRVVQAHAPWDNSTRGKKKKKGYSSHFIAYYFWASLFLSFPTPPLGLLVFLACFSG